MEWELQLVELRLSKAAGSAIWRMSWNSVKYTASVQFFVLLLCGCGSSPSTHYFTLDATSAVQPHAASTAPYIRVSAVHIPATLDRTEIVREKGPGELDVSSENRWGAPLDELVRRTLSQDLSRRLPPGAIAAPTAPQPRGVCEIVLDILQFGGKGSDDVVFDGTWTLLEAGTGKSLYTHHLNLDDQASAKDYVAQTTAMSRLVGRIADQIASAPPVNPSVCNSRSSQRDRGLVPTVAVQYIGSTVSGRRSGRAVPNVPLTLPATNA